MYFFFALMVNKEKKYIVVFDCVRI